MNMKIWHNGWTIGGLVFALVQGIGAQRQAGPDIGQMLRAMGRLKSVHVQLLSKNLDADIAQLDELVAAIRSLRKSANQRELSKYIYTLLSREDVSLLRMHELVRNATILHKSLDDMGQPDHPSVKNLSRIRYAYESLWREILEVYGPKLSAEVVCLLPAQCSNESVRTALQRKSRYGTLRSVIAQGDSEIAFRQTELLNYEALIELMLKMAEAPEFCPVQGMISRYVPQLFDAQQVRRPCMRDVCMVKLDALHERLRMTYVWLETCSKMGKRGTTR